MNGSHIFKKCGVSLPGLILAALLTVFLLSATSLRAGEEEKKADAETKHRIIVVGKDDPTPTNFHHRQGPGWFIRQINGFKKKLPEDHKARIVVEKYFNMNYGKVDDRIAEMAMIGPDGKKDGLQWVRGHGKHREIMWKDGKRHGKSKYYSRAHGAGGYLRKVEPWENGKIDGTVKVFHPNGKVMAEQPYVDGKKHGVSKIYSRDGKLQRKVPYKNGGKHGMLVEYWPRSDKTRRKIPYEKGKIHGTVKEFYRDESLKKEIEAWRGMFHGVETLYYQNGKPRGKRYWLRDELVEKEEFDKNYQVPPKKPKEDKQTED